MSDKMITGKAIRRSGKERGMKRIKTYLSFKYQIEMLPRISILYGEGKIRVALEWLWFGVFLGELLDAKQVESDGEINYPFVLLRKFDYFRLLHNHSRLAQMEYNRNPSFNDEWESNIIETNAVAELEDKGIFVEFMMSDSKAKGKT